MGNKFSFFFISQIEVTNPENVMIVQEATTSLLQAATTLHQEQMESSQEGKVEPQVMEESAVVGLGLEEEGEREEMEEEEDELPPPDDDQEDNFLCGVSKGT